MFRSLRRRLAAWLYPEGVAENPYYWGGVEVLLDAGVPSGIAKKRRIVGDAGRDAPVLATRHDDAP